MRLGVLAQLATIITLGLLEYLGERREIIDRLVGLRPDRHLQAHLTRQILDRFEEGHALVAHQKTDGAAVLAAAEAMIKLLVGADRERRGFFFVERTTGLVILTGLFERHAPIDQLDDIDARQ